MKTLIIPCAGNSSRFPEMKPKWLLTHPDGKLMLEKSISGFDINQFDRVIFTMLREHQDKYESRLITEQIFNIPCSQKFEILELNENTSCQAETVYKTLVNKDVNGPFVVKDSDNYVEFTLQNNSEFIVGLNINRFEKDINRLKSKSFLVVNDQNLVIDIIEKRIQSENICLGVYGFIEKKDYIKAYTDLISKNNCIEELYLSHVISFLIATKRSKYEYIEANKFEDYGTIEDWKNVQKDHITYFVDIDGVILKNYGKYGSRNWSNCCEVLNDNVNALKKLINNGAQIVFTTSRGDEYRSQLVSLFNSLGVKYHSIITGCNHTTRILINDFAPTNPYPSCKAINVPRNGNLRDYLG